MRENEIIIITNVKSLFCLEITTLLSIIMFAQLINGIVPESSQGYT